MRILASLFALLIVLTLSGCASSRDALGQGDSGRVLNLKEGQTITLRLAGNPAGGRTWEVTGLDTSVVQQRGEPKVEVGAAVGALARMYFYTYKFRAVNTGDTVLRMELLNPEKRDQVSAEVFELTLIVR